VEAGQSSRHISRCGSTESSILAWLRRGHLLCFAAAGSHGQRVTGAPDCQEDHRRPRVDKEVGPASAHRVPEAQPPRAAPRRAGHRGVAQGGRRTRASAASCRTCTSAVARRTSSSGARAAGTADRLCYCGSGSAVANNSTADTLVQPQWRLSVCSMLQCLCSGSSRRPPSASPPAACCSGESSPTRPRLLAVLAAAHRLPHTSSPGGLLARGLPSHAARVRALAPLPSACSAHRLPSLAAMGPGARPWALCVPCSSIKSCRARWRVSLAAPSARAHAAAGGGLQGAIVRRGRGKRARPAAQPSAAAETVASAWAGWRSAGKGRVTVAREPEAEAGGGDGGSGRAWVPPPPAGDDDDYEQEGDSFPAGWSPWRRCDCCLHQ